MEDDAEPARNRTSGRRDNVDSIESIGRSSFELVAAADPKADLVSMDRELRPQTDSWREDYQQGLHSNVCPDDFDEREDGDGNQDTSDGLLTGDCAPMA